MRVRTVVVMGFYALLLNACGGDDGGDNSGSGMAYAFVTPVVNTTRTYAEVVGDNSDNTIDIGYSQAVLSVAADGSVVELEQSTTGDSAVVNGTNYAIPTETESFNAMGQESSYTYTAADGGTVTCSFEPNGSGPDWPLRVGQTWDVQFTLTCGTAAPVTYVQSGTVVDVESVAVPAGIYSALKLQSTITWTNAAGTTRTETVTNWRDIASSHSVQTMESIVVSGTAPTTGYAVSRLVQMTSTS